MLAVKTQTFGDLPPFSHSLPENRSHFFNGGRLFNPIIVAVASGFQAR
jgi:hypothetical protein